MNTPQQQAELYRKAAETIEMCAKHGIEPAVKHMGVFRTIASIGLNDDFCKYEWPIAVIKGQLVWADTVVYNGHGSAFTASNILSIGLDINLFTLTPPKRTVMVEMLVEDAEFMVDAYGVEAKFKSATSQVAEACRKALDNLKG